MQTILIALICLDIIFIAIVLIESKKFSKSIKQAQKYFETSSTLELDEFEENLIDQCLLFLNEKRDLETRIIVACDLAQYLHSNNEITNNELEGIIKLKDNKSILLKSTILAVFNQKVIIVLNNLLLKKCRYEQ